MLRDGLGRTYQKVLLSQFALALVVIVAGLAIAGQQAAISALAGGVAVLAGSVAYMVLARQSKVSAVSAGRVFGRHLVAEAAKILLVLLLVFAALASGWFAAGWVLTAMAVTLLGHWLALLIIR
ncbi:MAG: hypothetical protein ABI905_02855 [Betaproteobacteria bacterium]